LALGVGAALASATGCLIVTPLDDLPQAHAGSSQGGSSRGGTSQGGTSQGGKNVAGSAEAGEGGAAGQAGKTPDGGAPSSTGCTSNAECVRAATDEPARCRASDHACVALKNDACPVVVGEKDAGNANAIYFGAFATLDRTAPADNSIIWAHQLALDELSGDNRGGLPDGPGGGARPLVMVVCDNAEDTVESGVQHLAEDLEVPAIVATLKPGDLRRAYDTYPELFYFSPVPITEPVVAKKDDGHIWSILGQPSDFAPTYAALLELSEAHVRAAPDFEDGAPIKVALVTTKDAFDSELNGALLSTLQFNGKSVLSNGENFAPFTIGEKPDFSALAAEISAFRPDIVISAASEQFLMTGGLQQTIEEDWELNTKAAPKARPFYILSPYNAGNLGPLTARISEALERAPDVEAQQRYVGVSVAAAADRTLQNAYALRLGSQFKSALKDTAQYYDAIYFLAYAMYGANQPEGLTGSGIAEGMRRLLDGTNVSIGPGAIVDAFDVLSTDGATLHLETTLGPPNFDEATGVRPVDGSVFCFTRQNNTASARIDVLRYDRDEQALTGKGFPCISGFFVP